MSWYCDCDEHGEYSNKVTLLRTKANSEGICDRCGHYAFWDEEKRANRTSDDVECKVTVYKHRTQEVRMFYNPKEAYKWAGISSESYFRHIMRQKIPYYKRGKVFILTGYVDNIREKFNDAMESKYVYAYDSRSGKLVDKGEIPELCERLGVNDTSIRYQLENKIKFNRCGYEFERKERV